MKFRVGNIIVALSLLFTIELFLLSKSSFWIIFETPWLSIAQISGLLGVVAYSITFVLSSRLDLLEYLFGGLDEVYRMHQRMGRISFIFLSLHFIGLLLNYSLQPIQTMNLLVPSTNLIYSAGILSFWSMAFILALVLFARLEYQLFIRIQTFFAISFLFGFLHSLFIASDISRFIWLRVYMLSFFGLGWFAILYRQFLYQLLGPKYNYTLMKVNKLSSGWIQLRLHPLGQKLRFISGQFVYIGFVSEGYKKETHPFSIVSTPNEEYIELWIKPVGDFTHSLMSLKEGEQARIYGPYGTLYEAIVSKKSVVCVAGGIGITPFIGMVRSFSATMPETMFTLFLSVRTQSDVEGLNIEQLLPLQNPNVSYTLRITESSDRLTAKDIMKSDVPLLKTVYLLCGPAAMMMNLKQQLFDSGVHPRAVVYEEFSY